MLYFQKLRPSRAILNTFVIAVCITCHAAAIETEHEEPTSIISKDATTPDRTASLPSALPSDITTLNVASLPELATADALLSKPLLPTLEVYTNDPVPPTPKAALISSSPSSPDVPVQSQSSPESSAVTPSSLPSSPSSFLSLITSTPNEPSSSSSPSTTVTSGWVTSSPTPQQVPTNALYTAARLLRSAHTAVSIPSSGSLPAFLKESASATRIRVQRTTPRPVRSNRPRTFARQASAPPGQCRTEGSCVPLSYCRMLVDLLDRSCLDGNRLPELTCGVGNREPLVCCPPGAFSSIYPPSPPPPPPTRPPPPTQPPPPPPPSPLPAKCGVPQVFNWRADYRGLGSQPWVARVGFKSVGTGAMQYPCCGSIISSRVILTAAHCALAKTSGYKLAAIRAGEFDSGQDPDCTASFCAHKVQDVAVSHVVVHPAYERATFLNDVALLVLRAPLNFTLSTQPVCLDGGNFNPAGPAGLVGSRAKLVGWGMTAGQTAVPHVQQQLDLPVVPLGDCSRLYDQVVPVTPQNLCVGGEPGHDACSGFGGAPLVILDSSSHSKFYQIAMVSFGSKQCGAPGVPSVHTRIDKYFDWIRANMNY